MELYALQQINIIYDEIEASFVRGFVIFEINIKLEPSSK